MAALLHAFLHSLDFDARLSRRRLPVVAGLARGILAGLNGGVIARSGESSRRRRRRQRRKNRRNRSSPGRVLYPDLRTALPEDLRFSTVDGDRVLRLTNTVWNDGEGRLELQGNPRPGEDEVVELFQNVYDEPIGGSLTFQRRVDGRIAYHPAHGHYHFADFASYELLARSESGSYEPIGESTKTSFCITDNAPRDERYPRQYVSCERELQGLTPGWLDT